MNNKISWKNVSSQKFAIAFFCVHSLAIILAVLPKIYFCKPDILLIVVMTVFAANVIAGIVLCAIFGKQLPDMSRMREKILEHKEEMSQNFAKYNSKKRKIVVLSVFYLILQCALYTAIMSVGILYAFTGYMLVFSILYPISLILLLSFLKRFCQKNITDMPPYIFLPQEQYPRIWQIAVKAKKQAGILLPIAILAVPGDNVGIRRESKHFELMVGCDCLRLLNPEELYSVFLHEFGHAKSKYTKDLRKDQLYGSLWASLSIGSLFFPFFLFAPFAQLVCNTLAEHQFLVSYRMELEADECVKFTGNSQSFISALAKINLWTIHYFELPKTTSILIYPTPPADYFEIMEKRFLKCYEDRKEQWDSICRNQLAAKIDTHPNLPERMKNLGITDYTLDFSKTDEALSAELKQIEEIIFPHVTVDWELARQYSYSASLEIVKNYEEGKGIGTPLSLVAYSYFLLTRYEDAMQIYDRILQENPDNAEALFSKGIILCDDYNNEGIKLLEKLLDNFNYFEKACDRLGRYLQFLGLSELRDEYRPKLYSKIDAHFDIALAKFNKLGYNTLSSEQYVKLREYLKSLNAKTFVFIKRIGTTQRNTLAIVFDDVSDAIKQHQCDMLLLFLCDTRINIDLYIIPPNNQSLIKKLSKYATL